MPYFSDNKFSDLEINLFLSYIIICLSLSFYPYHTPTWLVENATVWLCALVFIYVRIKKHRFSNLSLFIIFFAAVLQTIGGHFTFQHVPGENLFAFLGPTGRNNFDRFGHFFLGLLTYPLFEFMRSKKIAPSSFYTFALSAMCMMGVAALYELFEWLDFIIAEMRFGELYLGMQGDAWDAQADMLMCLLGSLSSGLIFLFERMILRTK